ncbi:MAG: amidohydrolase [Kiritimatiellaeota bacterium]|nr:amidohydrolase [Kiritimatiellota bacterium]
MNTLLIQNALHNGTPHDLLVEGARFKAIAPRLDVAAARTIDGTGKAIVPAFYNTHTHAAMTSMRGYADDIELFTWLHRHIWPLEEHIQSDDIYHFARLAILEMIRTGTVFFNDMYWCAAATAKAVAEMGVRAAIGRSFIESSPGVVAPQVARENAVFEALVPTLPERILPTFAPHAVYTVSGQTLRAVAEEARERGAFIHTHASETRQEVEDCMKAHGMTPVAWLDACGMLTPKTILAHAIHLTADDIALIRDRGCALSHNPCSNFKLASGQFRFRAVAEEGACRVTIGTDGCASNNNLSMLEEMKFAALSAKGEARDPTAAPAQTIFDCATRHGAEAFGIDAGVIAEGKLADALLVDLRHPLMVPCHNLVSNLVYAADSSCIDTVICDGRVLMENKAIPDERDIIDAAQDTCRRLLVSCKIQMTE